MKWRSWLWPISLVLAVLWTLIVIGDLIKKTTVQGPVFDVMILVFIISEFWADWHHRAWPRRNPK